MQIWQIDLTHIAAVAGAVGSVVSSAILLNKKIIKPVKRWLQRAETTHQIVSEQLSLNGGKSLKDIVMRLEDLHYKQKSDLQAYFSLLTSHNAAMWESDASGRCSWVNGIYKAWTGTGDDDVHGDAWLGSVFSEDREMVKRGWYESVNDKRDFESYHRMIDANGTPFWVHSYAVVRRANGICYGYVGRLERITSRPEDRPQIC